MYFRSLLVLFVLFTKCTPSQSEPNATEKCAIRDQVAVVNFAPFIFGNEAARAVVVEQMVAVLEDVGLLLLSGHGIPQPLIDSGFDLSKRFFSLPLEYKKEFALQVTPDGTYDEYVGYTSVMEEKLYGKYCDYKEVYDFNLEELKQSKYMSPETGEYLNMPFTTAKDRDAFIDLGFAMHTAVQYIAKAISLSMEGDRDFIARGLDGFHHAHLRFVHYPVYDPHNETFPSGQSLAPHTDYFPIVIGIQDSAGLQAWDKRNKRWLEIPYVPGTIILNLGDAMQIWSNGRYTATMHQMPAISHDRYAMYMFEGPGESAIIDPRHFGVSDDDARYDPQTLGQIVNKRIKAMHNTFVKDRDDQMYGDLAALDEIQSV